MADKAGIKSTYDRVMEGIAWLTREDSDPPGRFYLWHVAGTRPEALVLGSHFTDPADVRSRYARWVRAYEMWLRLYAQLEQEAAT